MKDELEKLLKRRVERENQNAMCVAHDLSPIFEAAFGLDWKSFKSEMTLQVVSNILNTKSGEKKTMGGTIGGAMGKQLKKAKSQLWGRKSDDGRQ